MRKSLLFFSILLLNIQTLFAQKTMNKSYESRWKTIDSLVEKGLDASAEKKVQELLTQARAEQNTEEYIHALCMLRATQADRDEKSALHDIQFFEQELNTAVFPAKQIIQSMIADLYWNYYSEHRWNIMDRTRGATATQNSDPETWSADGFYEKIVAYYQASLEMNEEAKRYPIHKLNKILNPSVNTDHLRPTLYDLLLHRALDFFKNDEIEITKPEYAFEIEDLKAFSDAKEFMNLRFKTSDTESPKYNTLELLQDALRFHANDTDPSAFIDVDLERLEYIYDKSTQPEKLAEYRSALLHLAKQYPKNELAGLATFRYAETLIDLEGLGTEDDNDQDTSNYLEAVKLCKQLVSDFPKTEVSLLASNLLLRMNDHSLHFTSEQVVLPYQPYLVKVDFKNINTLYCRLIKIDRDQLIKLQRYNNYNELDKIGLFFKLKAEKIWKVNLPKTEDYKKHSTEIALDALATGFYVLVASDHEEIGMNSETVYTTLQCSNLAYILPQVKYGRASDLFVVHRESGLPLAQVHVNTWIYNYDYESRSNQMKPAGSYVSDKNGKVSITSKNENVIPEIIQGDDHLLLFDNLYESDFVESYPEKTTAFLFTDRSIYRPGQTIYFKGILLSSKGNGYTQHNLLKNKKTKIQFYDQNYQLIKEQNLTTNNYGSIQGNFVAPEGLLTGQFSIQCEGQQTYVRVEEYKRPKFEVEFDTLKESYRLRNEVHVKGKAKAYAGNSIDGATVKYTVTRKARFPYWWCFSRWGMPNSEEMAIAHGTAKTNQEGLFDIRFTAVPDAAVNPATKPIFDYEVHADVTDINGETRSGETNISVGYQSMLLTMPLAEEIERSQWKELQLTTENLAGAPVASTVKISLKKLKAPSKIYRKRLWSKVDRPLWSREEFHQKFPLDEFNEENKPENWEAESTIWTKTIQTSDKGKYPISAPTEDGWYELEAKTTDSFGEEITEKKIIRCFHAAHFAALPNEILRYRGSQEKYEPGQQATLEIASAYTDLHLLYSTTYGNPSGKKQEEWLSLNKLKTISYVVREEDRGGFFGHFIFIKNNRAYSGVQSFTVPWTNKELRIQTETFRDKMLPGSEQEWKLKITGSKKEKVSAELLATMYDASLDAFAPHQWQGMHLFSNNYAGPSFATGNNFISKSANLLYRVRETNEENYNKEYNSLKWWALRYDYRVMEMTRGYNADVPAAGMVKHAAPVLLKANRVKAEEKPSASAADSYTWGNMGQKYTVEGSVVDSIGVLSVPPVDTKNISLRSNFAETAFFFPQLQTDAEGNVILKFKAPESLTKWKMMAYAHTEALQEGTLEQTSVTQKDIMIVPNTPRFLREGDHMMYTAKISNLTNQVLLGSALLQVVDAIDEKNVDALFGNTLPTIAVKLQANGSEPVQWNLQIPEGFTHPVYIKTYIQTDKVSDGEQNTLPVLLNSQLVTETLPLSVKANEHKTYSFKKLLQSDQSNTLRHYNLSVEYTSNPAWYAVQALPYLVDYPYDCSEQTFNRFYANALATYLANSNPKIKSLFANWKEKDSAALLSNLEKNQELKSALLQETPWVLQAQNEKEQKKNLAVLFDVHRMSKELERTTRELELMQTPNGGFAWFKGMPDDRFITQYIVAGIGRLKHLGVKETGSEARIQQILAKAIPYLDARLVEDYNELLKEKVKMPAQQISTYQIHWLYMRSFFLKEYPLDASTKTAFQFYKKLCGEYGLKNNKYMQAMSAVVLHRLGDTLHAKQLVSSLRENAIHEEELGMYWKELNSSYWWYEAPIESMSMLIECFHEVAQSESEVDEMKIWLLKNKQTNQWQTTKATADACYALLLNGTYWLASQPKVEIRLGNTKMNFPAETVEAGTGYRKQSIVGAEVKSNMGTVDVRVDGGKGITWGAVYWQYFENLDKISAAETPLQLKKTLYKVESTAKGDMLKEITANSPLAVGDQVKVKIELRVNRVMEYVHLKDMRAACFEPVNVLSQYQYQNGLGYYEATKDLATNFFFSYLPVGTYVFEYPMFVTHQGSYSNGIASAQCMYAPEFSSHSEGLRVEIK